MQSDKLPHVTEFMKLYNMGSTLQSDGDMDEDVNKRTMEHLDEDVTGRLRQEDTTIRKGVGWSNFTGNVFNEF